MEKKNNHLHAGANMTQGISYEWGYRVIEPDGSWRMFWHQNRLGVFLSRLGINKKIWPLGKWTNVCVVGRG